jgi:hypothetical protein
MYDIRSLKADGAWGLFNGTIFTMSYGFVNGSYYAYNKDITST